MSTPTNFPPAPRIPGIVFAACRAAGTAWHYEIAFESGADSDTVVSLLRHLQPDHEVCFDGPGPDESYLLARFTGSQFQTKTAYHGCSGTWRTASFDEAVEHLRPAVAHHGGTYLHRYGSYWIYPDKRNA